MLHVRLSIEPWGIASKSSDLLLTHARPSASMGKTVDGPSEQAAGAVFIQEQELTLADAHPCDCS